MTIHQSLSLPNNNFENFLEIPVVKNKTVESEVSLQQIAHNLTADFGIGMWLILPESGKITICPIARKLFGKVTGECYNVNGLIRSLVIEDAKKLLNGLKEACRKKSNINVDLRLNRLTKGEFSWLRIAGKFVSAKETGSFDQIRGTIIDVTKEKNHQTKREDYIHLLNHELKSPLTTMKLYIQAAKKRSSLKKEQLTVEMLSKAEHQVGAMCRMIDNFLGDSMAANAKIPIAPKDFTVLELLHEVASEMGHQHPSRCFEIEFSSDAIVWADREKIAQVLVNYLSNAVKYSTEGSPIIVKYSIISQQLQVSVSDCGAGISLKDQHKVFDRFYRTHTTSAKGFGLGLYLVKEIILQHQGKVWVDSCVGKGSTFFFSLPVRKPVI